MFIGCRDQKIQSKWTGKEINIDGYIEDWKDIPRYYEKDLKMMFSVSNDSDNVFMMYCFNDPDLARMIALRGINLWINDRGKNDKDFGISFKRQFGEPQENFGRDGQRRRFHEESPAGINIKNMLDRCEFLVQIRDSLSDTPIADLTGTEAAFNVTEGLYGFEFKLPLAELSHLRSVVTVPASRKLKVGLEIPEATTSMRGRHRSGMELPDDGGMRGGYMGGRSGRAPGFGRNFPDMSAKEIWATVFLAGKSDQ